MKMLTTKSRSIRPFAY